MKSTDKGQSDQPRALNETVVNLAKSVNEGMVNIETALYRASQLNAIPLPNHQFLPTQSPYGQNNGSLNPVQRQLNTNNFFSSNDAMDARLRFIGWRTIVIYIIYLSFYWFISPKKRICGCLISLWFSFFTIHAYINNCQQ